MSDWQPIDDDTPRDGTEILGWHESFGRIVVRWENGAVFGLPLGGPTGWLWVGYYESVVLTGTDAPTLWQPLPEPPK
jgi:hypothetical protein